MKALKCDFCKTYFDFAPNRHDAILITHKDSKGVLRGDFRDPVYDLCPECINKIKALKKPDEE